MISSQNASHGGAVGGYPVAEHSAKSGVGCLYRQCVSVTSVPDKRISTGVKNGPSQFLAHTTYLARRYRSMKKCVAAITSTASQLPTNRNGSEYTIEWTNAGRCALVLFCAIQSDCVM